MGGPGRKEMGIALCSSDVVISARGESIKAASGGLIILTSALCTQGIEAASVCNIVVIAARE